MKAQGVILKLGLFYAALLLPYSGLSGGSVTVWGYYYNLDIPESFLPMYVPAGLTNVVAVSGGYNAAVALRSDGTVVAWGWDGNTITNVPAGLSNVTAIAAGDNFGLALESDGHVVSWGFSGTGGTNVPASLSNVVAVSASQSVSVALKSDGTVTTWGGGLPGPPTPPAGLSNVIAIAAGDTTVLALKQDGTVTALRWGNQASAETNVPVGLRNVAAIASGYLHGLALKTDGTVVAWGDNSVGQTNVPAGLSNVVAIAAGYNHSLALTSDGSVVAWGAGTSVDPAPCCSAIQRGQSIVPAGLSNVFALAGGLSFSLAVTDAAGPPVIGTPLTDQSAGEGANVSMRVFATGANPLIYQWFHNGTNLPGATNLALSLNGVRLDQSGAYSVVVSNLSGGITNSCNLSVVPLLVTVPPQNIWVYRDNPASFSVKAEGLNPQYQWQFNGVDIPNQTGNTLVIDHAQFGNTGAYSVVVSNGPTSYTLASATLQVKQIAIFGDDTGLPADLTNAIAIGVGGLYRVALRANHTVTAWGQNAFGQTNVPTSLTNAIAIAAGGEHVLALRDDGTVVAWGDNSHGQTNVPTNLTNVVSIAAGGYHNVALRNDGTVVGWGDYYGDAGTIPVPSNLSNVVAISARGYNSMALKSDGSIIVWGVNYYGQTNVPANLTNVLAISVGDEGNTANLFALTADRRVISWGYNAYNETNVPAGLSNVVAVSGGYFSNVNLINSMALTIDGTVTTWSYSNAPTGLHNVIAIAGADMALIGDGPPVIQTLLTNLTEDASGFQTSLVTQSGYVYALEYKNSLNDPTWTPLSLVAGNGGVLTLTNVPGANPQRFYRVRRW